MFFSYHKSQYNNTSWLQLIWPNILTFSFIARTTGKRKRATVSLEKYIMYGWGIRGHMLSFMHLCWKDYPKTKYLSWPSKTRLVSLYNYFLIPLGIILFHLIYLRLMVYNVRLIDSTIIIWIMCAHKILKSVWTNEWIVIANA